MKVRDSLGVPDNLRAMDDQRRAKPRGFYNNYDTVKKRKKAIVEFCGSVGKTSDEIALEFGYSSSVSAQYMISQLRRSNKLYKGKYYRYYAVSRPKPVEPEQTQIDPVIDAAISLGEAVNQHKTETSNEDKLIAMVEELAKDFAWQADGIAIDTVKRFVEYIKSKRENS